MTNILASARRWVTGQTKRASTRALHQAALEATPATPPVSVRACVVCTLTRHRRTPVRAAILNPYVIDLLAEDARHSGPSAHLDVVLTTRGASIRAVQRALAPLRQRGVGIRIRRPSTFPRRSATAIDIDQRRGLNARHIAARRNQ